MPEFCHPARRERPAGCLNAVREFAEQTPRIDGSPARPEGNFLRWVLRQRRCTVGFLRSALKSGLAVKAAQVVMREASKPENQRKARELVQKLQEKRRRSS
jgi:hypothetical protein